jgi:hypothetical protein
VIGISRKKTSQSNRVRRRRCFWDNHSFQLIIGRGSQIEKIARRKEQEEKTEKREKSTTCEPQQLFRLEDGPQAYLFLISHPFLPLFSRTFACFEFEFPNVSGIVYQDSLLHQFRFKQKVNFICLVVRFIWLR